MDTLRSHGHWGRAPHPSPAPLGRHSPTPDSHAHTQDTAWSTIPVLNFIAMLPTLHLDAQSGGMQLRPLAAPQCRSSMPVPDSRRMGSFECPDRRSALLALPQALYTVRISVSNAHLISSVCTPEDCPDVLTACVVDSSIPHGPVGGRPRAVPRRVPGHLVPGPRVRGQVQSVRW